MAEESEHVFEYTYNDEEFSVSVSGDCTTKVTSKDGSITISADRGQGGYRIVGFDEYGIYRSPEEAIGTACQIILRKRSAGDWSNKTASGYSRTHSA